MMAFRHCDRRFPFLWSSRAQPPARWHGANEGPVNYLADTPVGAWAEFLRHEEITDPQDLKGIARSLWAVELCKVPDALPNLPETILKGGLESYSRCQAEARRLRAEGAEGLRAPSAALKAGGASGWIATPQETEAPLGRDGEVFALFGRPVELVGWPVVEGGAPPERILALVNPL